MNPAVLAGVYLVFRTTVFQKDKENQASSPTPRSSDKWNTQCGPCLSVWQQFMNIPAEWMQVLMYSWTGQRIVPDKIKTYCGEQS